MSKSFAFALNMSNFSYYFTFNCTRNRKYTFMSYHSKCAPKSFRGDKYQFIRKMWSCNMPLLDLHIEQHCVSLFTMMNIGISCTCPA